MEKIREMSIDLETYSDVNISKCGAYKYAESDQFEILLFGVSINGGPVQVYDLACGYSIPEDPASKYLDPSSWKCSMTWSAYLGLPLSLAGAGAVLGLEEQKLTERKDLIRYFCVPCKPTKANGGRTRNLPQHDSAKWIRFKEYNRRDVEVEMSIQKRLSKYPVPEQIWDEYHLD